MGCVASKPQQGPGQGQRVQQAKPNLDSKQQASQQQGPVERPEHENGPGSRHEPSQVATAAAPQEKQDMPHLPPADSATAELYRLAGLAQGASTCDLGPATVSVPALRNEFDNHRNAIAVIKLLDEAEEPPQADQQAVSSSRLVGEMLEHVFQARNSRPSRQHTVLTFLSSAMVEQRSDQVSAGHAALGHEITSTGPLDGTPGMQLGLQASSASAWLLHVTCLQNSARP